MSDFDKDKDYDLDYFASGKDNDSESVDDEFVEEESYDLNAFSSSLEEAAEDGALSAGDDSEIDDAEVDFNSFGKKRKQIKKENAVDKKEIAIKALKITGKALLSVMLIGIITGCLVVAAFAIYVFQNVDDTVYENLDDLKLNFTTTIYMYDETTKEYVVYERLPGAENRIWKGFDEIPEDLKNAFVAVEDQRFYSHNGVDWKRTIGAFANMFVKLYSSNQGGSTITQQLVKNLTDDRDQTAMRKIREIMRARYLESHYEKDTILECYLNTICLAGGMYGVEVAANYYFGKPASELTLVECAAIASLAKEPEKYRPDRFPENNKKRRDTVLALMYEQEYITEAEYKQAKKADINVVCDKTAIKSEQVNNYFVDTVIDEVITRLAEERNFDEAYAAKNFYNGGYKIYCTVNPKVQETLEAEYAKTDTYFKYKKKGQTVQSAMTIMDYQGHIVGIVGGGGAKTADRELNRATMTLRQPGSTIKPLAAYSQALQKNLICYSTIIEDSPIEKYYYSTGEAGPKNWYKQYLGNVTIATALERSINTVPCKLVKSLRVEDTYYYLSKNLGITLDSKEDMNLSSLGLGGTYTGITVTQSTAAFAVFGNLGNYYEPTTFTKVTDQHDNVILEQKEGIAAMDENTAEIMNHLLQTVVYGANGTGDVAKGYHKEMLCYAKTGTSTNANDCWFVGGTPYYVSACWFGYDEPSAVSPSNLAKKMWTNVMKEIHKELEVKEFPTTEFVTTRYYCAQTGLLATDACSSIGIGYYKTNFSLPGVCSAHAGKQLGAIKELPKDSKPGVIIAQKPAEGDGTTSDTSSSSSDTSSNSSASSSSSNSSESSSESNSEKPTTE